MDNEYIEDSIKKLEDELASRDRQARDIHASLNRLRVLNRLAGLFVRKSKDDNGLFISENDGGKCGCGEYIISFDVADIVKCIRLGQILEIHNQLKVNTERFVIDQMNKVYKGDDK